VEKFTSEHLARGGWACHKRAGVHYGDPIVSVNGVRPYRKSMAELHQLFSSSKPTEMTLVIDRDGEIKTFKFELAKAHAKECRYL
jgi:C-terminal processing protease CtpA/Prc